MNSHGDMLLGATSKPSGQLTVGSGRLSLFRTIETSQNCRSTSCWVWWHPLGICTFQQKQGVIHLAKLIPQRFLKPAVCKYPTTVNNSEIYILLPKSSPWMWHLICGNRVRNASDREPETDKTRLPKLALIKISYRRCAVILPVYHADMHIFTESAQRTPTRQAISATHKRCAHHPCHHWFHSALHCTAHCP